MAKTQSYTVFVQDVDGGGTIHIQAYRAKSIDGAIKLSLRQVRHDWGRTTSTLHILGVAAGDVKILEWTDLGVG